MAMNPMQRRARTSFILGFLVALIMGAIAVGALLLKIRSINDAKEALEALQVDVYVAKDDLESGEEVTLDSFEYGTVQTTVPKDQMLENNDFEFKNEDGDIVTKLDEEGNELKRNLAMKIAVPKGTIITKDMLYEVGNELDSSERIHEFNMISLPSQLKNGEYIDVRITYPNGQDFVILSKKKVLGTNATAVWLQLNELELALMNNAIVESYMIAGSKLYALEFVEAGMQQELTPTYVASADATNLMNKDPNITDEIKEIYASAINGLQDFRSQNIEGALDAVRDQRDSLVSAGNSNELESIRAQRQEYVDTLEGTDDIGYIEE